MRGKGPSPRSWLLVTLAWLAVLAPLFWGIWKTMELARQLFR
jgi:hypothetical protein